MQKLERTLVKLEHTELGVYCLSFSRFIQDTVEESMLQLTCTHVLEKPHCKSRESSGASRAIIVTA